MKKGSFLKRSAVVAFSVLLMAGCGGSGVGDDTSGGGTDGGTDGGTGDPVSIITAESSCIAGVSASTPEVLNVDEITNQLLQPSNSGSADAVKQSQLTFSICGENSRPVSGRTISLSFTGNPQNAHFSGIGPGLSTTITTDANGQAAAVVIAGNPGIISVRSVVTIDSDTELSAFSTITVAGGALPHEESFSVGVVNGEGSAGFNLDGLQFIGTKSTISASASVISSVTHPGFPVLYKTWGGSIVSAGQCVSGVEGCSVDWRSQNPRYCFAQEIVPSVGVAAVDHWVCGIARVMIYTAGVETFDDPAGSGIYGDATDDGWNAVTQDVGEQFLDIDWSNSYEAVRTVNLQSVNATFGSTPVPASLVTTINEPYVDNNTDGDFDLAGDGIYTGICAATATCNVGTVTLARSVSLTMSGRSAELYILNQAGKDAYDAILQNAAGAPCQAAGNSASECSRYSFQQFFIKQFLEAGTNVFENGDTMDGVGTYYVVALDVNYNLMASDITMTVESLGGDTAADVVFTAAYPNVNLGGAFASAPQLVEVGSETAGAIGDQIRVQVVAEGTTSAITVTRG